MALLFCALMVCLLRHSRMAISPDRQAAAVQAQHFHFARGELFEAGQRLAVLGFAHFQQVCDGARDEWSTAGVADRLGQIVEHAAFAHQAVNAQLEQG